jgi:ubiquinone/menaquinone biosynthesis C-methylase UbiE
MNENWRVWDEEKGYGDLFFDRATGKLTEMESSKAAAKVVSSIAKEHDVIMDVGCGAGHYLVSLDSHLQVPFSYIGLDATSYYIELARKAFLEGNTTNPLRINTSFEVADIYDLASKYNIADIVMCNNVLLHLPSINKPLQELWKATKKYLIVRTLIGKVSFRIKQINYPEEYNENGDPIHFHYFNIYSEEYIKKLIGNLASVSKYSLIQDTDYNPDNLVAPKSANTPHDLTTVVNGMQVNNYIIQPWSFVLIEKKRQ